MIIYVANGGNLQNVAEIVNKLQTNDLANCYISPVLNFSHLKYGQIGRDDEDELKLDLLSIADRLIIAGESKGIQAEIEFAKLVKMEVMRLDENGELQPFAE